jgi:hypothetical protein
MTYRIHERQIVEALLKISHVPYRSEMDETHRRIYELRKEVRELKRAFLETRAERSGRNETNLERSGPAGKPKPASGNLTDEEGS